MPAEMDDTNPPPILPSSTNERQKAPSEAESSKMKRKASKPIQQYGLTLPNLSLKKVILKINVIIILKFFADPKRNGTTNMKSHMGVCKNRLNVSGDSSQTELVFESERDTSLGTQRFNQDVVRKGVADMVIVNELPFRFVDGKGFKNCMALTCPRFHVPSRWTIFRDCYKIYVDEKVKLKQVFNTSAIRVSLTIDTWTSLQKINYMCLTGHFIEKD